MYLQSRTMLNFYLLFSKYLLNERTKLTERSNSISTVYTFNLPDNQNGNFPWGVGEVLGI